MSDSLKDSFKGLGDTEFKDEIVKRFGDKLQNQEVMGEEIDVVDVGTSMRKYDHGQANSQTVTEVGVQISFDADKVELSKLKEGGEIREEIKTLADNLITNPVDYIDLSFVTNEKYELWVVIDANDIWDG